MEVKDWLTLVASLGALFFLLLNYQRSSRFDNSNHLFKLKVDVYSKILSELNKLLGCLSDQLVKAKLHIENPSDLSGKELENSADEIDKVIYGFANYTTENSLIIPKKVLLQLQQFSNYILTTDMDVEDDDADIEMINKLDNMIDEIINKGNNINELMRKDLHIEKLNDILYKRLK